MLNLEQQVLSNIYWQSEFTEQAGLLTELNLSDFKESEFREMYICFNNILMKRQRIDAVSVYEADKNMGLRCARFSESKVPSFKDSLNHIRMLKERNYRDEIKEKLGNWVKDLSKENDTDKFDELKNRIIVGLSQVELDTGCKFINPVEFTEKIDENMKKDVGLEGVSWGLTDLDSYTSGIVTPRLIVIGGLKKTGKSRFVINTRFHLYKNKIPSVFLSLEMPGYEVTKLVYSRFTQIVDTHFRSVGFMSNEEKSRYETVKREIDWNLLPTECASNLNINQILQRLRIYQRIYKNPIVFIDYLQRVKHNRDKQAQELEEISNVLADATRTFGITIILLSQLSNLAEREDISIGHLKGCVEENSLIDGIPIKEYYKNQLFNNEISTFDTKNKIHLKHRPLRIINSGIKNCFEITTKTGKKIIISEDTRLFTENNKWKFGHNLKIGEKILVNNGDNKL